MTVQQFLNVFVAVNNGERAVWTFTLRDSEEDFINVTVWGTVEFVKKLVATFRIGTVGLYNSLPFDIKYNNNNY